MQIYASYELGGYKQRNLNKFYILCGCIVLAILGVLSIKALIPPPPLSPVSSYKTTEKPAKVLGEATSTKTPGELKLKIKDALDDSIPEYSIMVDDFLSPLQVTVGDSNLYVGASVHKLAIVAAVYAQIQKNEVGLNDKITFEESDRQDYGTGTMRYEDSGKQYTVKELASLMLKKSDNTAAYIMARKVVNLRDIQTIINGFGLTETSMADNMTSNKDMDILLKKLFTGRILNANLTRDVINLLRDSDFEDRIPALLPNNTLVYHKIGTTIAGLHDVGVVVTPKSMYYVGIFTRGVSDEDRATKAISRVSRAIYDYMEQ